MEFRIAFSFGEDPFPPHRRSKDITHARSEAVAMGASREEPEEEVAPKLKGRALKSEDNHMAAYAIQRLAKVDPDASDTALLSDLLAQAAARGWKKTINALLGSGQVDPWADGGTAVFHAAREENLAIMDSLLEACRAKSPDGPGVRGEVWCHLAERALNISLSSPFGRPHADEFHVIPHIGVMPRHLLKVLPSAWQARSDAGTKNWSAMVTDVLDGFIEHQPLPSPAESVVVQKSMWRSSVMLSLFAAGADLTEKSLASLQRSIWAHHDIWHPDPSDQPIAQDWAGVTIDARSYGLLARTIDVFQELGGTRAPIVTTETSSVAPVSVRRRRPDKMAERWTVDLDDLQPRIQATADIFLDQLRRVYPAKVGMGMAVATTVLRVGSNIRVIFPYSISTLPTLSLEDSFELEVAVREALSNRIADVLDRTPPSIFFPAALSSIHGMEDDESRTKVQALPNQLVDALSSGSLRWKAAQIDPNRMTSVLRKLVSVPGGSMDRLLLDLKAEHTPSEIENFKEAMLVRRITKIAEASSVMDIAIALVDTFLVDVEHHWVPTQKDQLGQAPGVLADGPLPSPPARRPGM